MADIERHSIDVEHSDNTEQHKNRATATGGKYKAMDDTTDEDDAKRPLRSNSFSETVLDVVANIRSQKLSVKCDWNFRDATHTEQIARQKRLINQAKSPGFSAVLRKDEPVLHYLMSKKPQLRGFVGETTLHNAFLLANAVDGWDVCRRLVDKFPNQVADEYACDEHADIEIMMDQVNSEWSHKQDPLTGGTNSTYLSDPLPCTGSVVHTAGDVLPGLYTGENVLHIAIVSLNVDMVKFLLNHPGVRGQQQRRLLAARAHGVFFMPDIFAACGKKYHDSMDEGQVPMAENNESRCYMGEFPYSFACCRGSTEIMDLIWNAAVDCKVSNKNFYHRSRHARSTGFGDGTRTEALWHLLRHAVMVEWEATQRIAGLIAPIGSLRGAGAAAGPACSLLDVDYLRPQQRLYPMVPDTNAVNIAFCQDCFGNTALHLAVMNGNDDAIDMILDKHCPKPAGDHSPGISPQAEELLRRLNNECMSPLTHAVRVGNVEMYEHIKARMKRTLWVYGNIALEQHPLEQFDSWQEDSTLSSWDGIAKCWQRCCGHKIASEAVDQAAVSDLHTQTRWISAVEIITRYEVEDFAQHADYLDCLDHKWGAFARNAYVIIMLLPTMFALYAFDAWRRNFPYALTSYSDLTNGSLAGGEVSALDHVNSHLSVSSFYLFVFFVVQALLAVSGFRDIFKNGWERAIDVDLDRDVSTTELVRFSFKILPHLISILLGVGFVACMIVGGRSLFACMAILLWLYFLLTLVPFQAFGLTLNTLVQMIVIDVVPFLSVFVMLMVGFAAAFCILVEDPNNNKDTWLGALNALFYVSMGEVGGGYDEEAFEGMTRNVGTAKAIWILWCFLSTVIAMNLLIAKMSSTYERIEESALTEYIFPRARTILQMESLLMDWLPLSWTIEWRYGGPSDPDVVEGVLEEDVEDLLRLNQETKGSAANMDGWTSGNADLDMWAPHVRKVKNYCLTKVVTLGDDDDKKEGTQQLLEAVAQLSAKVDALAAQQGGSKPPGNPR